MRAAPLRGRWRLRSRNIEGSTPFTLSRMAHRGGSGSPLGEWSAETLEDEAGDLAAIGDALGTDRDLLLWSCYAGEGTRGRALVDALHRVTGAPVGAATHLVGAAALGGGWELNTLSRRGSIVRPPLTEVGVAQYAGLCAVGAIGAAEVSVDNYIKVVWNETSPAGTYFIVANDKGAQKVIGEFEIPPGGYKARIFVSDQCSRIHSLSLGILAR